ncbi:MAG TPA: glycosyltransferase family 1 protein [Gemmatimonadales bacterium]|nr:glycosyltransferase family 1 protein [Gemmatimonadales bacterium]
MAPFASRSYDWRVRVGINARLLTAPDRRGFNRYTAELVRALAAAGRVEPVLFSDGPIHPLHRLEEIPRVLRYVRPQALWQHRWLPAALRRERIDLFHAPAHWGVPWHSPCPVVATIHDLADRERPELQVHGGLRAAARHELEQWLVVRRTRRIIAVSEWTASSIVRRLGVERERVAVTVEGAAPAFDIALEPARVASVCRACGLDAPYFLYVGGFDARKNLGAVIAALGLQPPDRRVAVALVGEGGPAADALRQRAGTAGVLPWLRLLGAVDDAKLAALYAGAVALVMPSWLEGFGLPVVEAMHAGTPAIVSDSSSLPEIAGDAALLFPPGEPAALAEAMGRLATDPALRGRLASKARQRAPLFTWRRAAEQTLAIYEAALS